MKFRIKKYVYSGMFLAVLLLSHSAQDVYGKKKNLPPVLPPAKPSFPATEITIPMVEFPKYPETGKLELLASPRKMILPVERSIILEWEMQPVFRIRIRKLSTCR